MQITRNALATGAGPADWFTGTVLIDTITSPEGNWTLGAAAVHFTPGARTAWHTHPDDAYRHAARRRERQPRHLGRARQRGAVRERTRHHQGEWERHRASGSRPGSKKTRSPGRITSIGPPSRWQRP